MPGQREHKMSLLPFCLTELRETGPPAFHARLPANQKLGEQITATSSSTVHSMKQEWVLMSVTEDRPASQQLRQQHGHVYGLESDHQTGVHFGVLSSCDRRVSSANALTLQLTLKSHVCAVHMQAGPRSRLSLEHSVSGDIVCRRT